MNIGHSGILFVPVYLLKNLYIIDILLKTGLHINFQNIPLVLTTIWLNDTPFSFDYFVEFLFVSIHLLYLSLILAVWLTFNPTLLFIAEPKQWIYLKWNYAKQIVASWILLIYIRYILRSTLIHIIKYKI